MNTTDGPLALGVPALPNGSGAAAILAAAMGCFALALLALAGDKSVAIKNSLNFYKPTGPLSGVTTVAMVIWFSTWALFEWRWRNKTVAAGRTNVVALILLGLSLLLTFPPIMDIF